MALEKLAKKAQPGGKLNSRRMVWAEELDAITAQIETEGISTTGNVVIGGDLTVTGTTTLNGDLVLGDAAADSLTINATTTYTDPVNYSNQTGITAFATGGQASATALTEEINNVTTVATAGDSVKLPAAVAGKHIHIKNSGATALDIFPASADSIDALAVNLAIRIQPGSSVDFYAKDATVWESNVDQSFTLVAPTTNTGQLELKATSSAGNTVTTITNASQAAARTYTIPDSGTNTEFVMGAGAQNIAGIKTFTDTTDSTSKDTGAIITEGGIGVEKAVFAGGKITTADLTASASSTTGSLIAGGGAGIAGDIYAGASINAATALTVGTDQTFAKEVNHTISVAASTTGATGGGNLTISSGNGNGAASGAVTVASATETGADATGDVAVESGQSESAASGNVSLKSGVVTTLGNSGTAIVATGRSTVSGNSGNIQAVTGDATTGDSGSVEIITGPVSTLGTSGDISLTTGNSDTSGDTGSVSITTGAAAIGGTGDITITSGNTASGLSGDIILTTGTDTSVTVEACIQLVNAVVHKPKSSTVDSGGTITGPELVGGLIAATGATGNWQLPTAAQITTAIGATPAGTNFEFVFNAAAMTATNTATLVVGASMTVASAAAITGGGTLTVTQDTQVTAGFQVVYDTPTTCKIYRKW